MVKLRELSLEEVLTRNLKGPKGDRGPVGPKGPKGNRGEKGDRGDIGPAGRDGRDGVGMAGPAGLQGERGPQGPKGDRGPVGPPGADGAKGDVGPIPSHKWEDTKLRFQVGFDVAGNPKFGKAVDLRGRPGSDGAGSGGSTISTLGQLRDTNIGAPGDADVLTYNASENKWEPQPASGGVTDHGALTGLADDDHPQYLNNTRADSEYLRLDTSNDPLTGELVTQEITPDSAATRDLGSSVARFRDLLAISVNAATELGLGPTEIDTGISLGRRSNLFGVLNNGSISAASLAALRSTGLGSLVLGSVHQQDGGISSTSVAETQATGNGSIAVGNSITQSNGNALLSAEGFGTAAFGYTVGQNPGGNATLRSGGLGTFAQGSSVAINGPSALETSGNGAFAQGLALAYTPALTYIRAISSGSFAQGVSQGGGQILSGNAGAFAQGRTASAGTITSIGLGSFAQGVSQAGGQITATGLGAFAQGAAINAASVVRATGTGSFAQGMSSGALVVEALAANAAQFGPGTNSQANSLQVGSAGLRFMGVPGAAASPQDGDFYLIGSDLNFRSGGAIVGPWNQPAVTGSRGGNAALASLLSQLAAMNIITDSTTA